MRVGLREPGWVPIELRWLGLVEELQMGAVYAEALLRVNGFVLQSLVLETPTNGSKSVLAAKLVERRVVWLHRLVKPWLLNPSIKTDVLHLVLNANLVLVADFSVLEHVLGLADSIHKIRALHFSVFTRDHGGWQFMPGGSRPLGRPWRKVTVRQLELHVVGLPVEKG